MFSKEIRYYGGFPVLVRMAYYGLVLFIMAFFIAILIAINKCQYMLKHKFYLRTARCNSAGQSALYFLVNTKPNTWIATNIFIHPQDWDQSRKQLFTSCPDYYSVSSSLNELKAKADNYLQKLKEEKRDFSAGDFTRSVITGDLSNVFNPLLIELATECKDVNSFSIGRDNHYKLFCKEMQDYRPGSRIKDVTHVFALGYEKYLKNIGNNKNTISRKMKMLKVIVHFAQRKKIITSDPLAGYRISFYRGKRTVLNKSEFLLLNEIAITRTGLPERLMPALDCFIFCCYTGLRYGDLKTLKQSDIQNNYIRIDMHKTGLPVSIPVLPAAARLLSIQEDGHCFRVLANAVFNRFLKEIADITGIQKQLSTRVARHTFATLSISLGIPIKVVSEILGHTSVKTTEIYISVLEETKTEEMKKWEGLTIAHKATG